MSVGPHFVPDIVAKAENSLTPRDLNVLGRP
jgi:hypothetical protein